ncbi:hypothetical protein [Thiothrix fructosivorans]|uniref:Lipoprotein n=1 Tax=Thiothrix fructosivorans TaxID=111770 RepID=A0A8B0SLD2_9GAMM|nr:hypothetical protein [Thiothrix fructosivorans]MBO0612645.1 hypothetical protein [Thiothrix fructosivorans]QTX11885.1 hypothetical protein J1836_005985 [Thiothrix fructosivorans]
MKRFSNQRIILLIVISSSLFNGCTTVGIEDMSIPPTMIEGRGPCEIKAWFWEKAYWTGCLSDLKNYEDTSCGSGKINPVKDCN